MNLDIDHPSFDYGWSPHKEEAALSPEGAAADEVSAPLWQAGSPSATWIGQELWAGEPLTSRWQDEFAQQESALLATALAAAPLAAAPARRAAPPEPARAKSQPLPVVHLVSESAANSAADGADAARRPEAARKAGSAAAAGPQMMDKRRCRLVHAPSFRAAIEAYRAQPTLAIGAAAEAAAEGPRVAAFVRKRPLLPHEEERGDYDALSVAQGRLVAHACLMKPDLRRMCMQHATPTPNPNPP